MITLTIVANGRNRVHLCDALKAIIAQLATPATEGESEAMFTYKLFAPENYMFCPKCGNMHKSMRICNVCQNTQ